MPEEDLLQINLWMGAMETTTNMHYDANHNLLFVLKGTKRVALLPPSMTAGVHAMPVRREARDLRGGLAHLTNSTYYYVVETACTEKQREYGRREMDLGPLLPPSKSGPSYIGRHGCTWREDENRRRKVFLTEREGERKSTHGRTCGKNSSAASTFSIPSCFGHAISAGNHFPSTEPNPLMYLRTQTPHGHAWLELFCRRQL